MDKIIGSELKIRINVTQITSCKFADTNFEAKFYTSNKNKYQVLRKNQMKKIDNDTYLCVVDSALLGTGRLAVDIKMYVPDPDCADKNRVEVVRGISRINIIE